MPLLLASVLVFSTLTKFGPTLPSSFVHIADGSLERIGSWQRTMGTYIDGGPRGRQDGEPQNHPVERPERTVFTFPILAAVLSEFQAMSESTSSSGLKTGRPRGRRAAAKVPCDDCIARASEKKDEGASIELCEKCTAVLHRPRRKQQEQPNIKRIRRQSNAIIDTAL